MSTPYHAKYLAHELTKRVSADNAEKLSQSLCNATVDLNPHQVEAALFAFRSPLSRGAVLADRPLSTGESADTLRAFYFRMTGELDEAPRQVQRTERAI